MKQLEKYSSFQELKSDKMSDDLSVVREREINTYGDRVYVLGVRMGDKGRSDTKIYPKKS